MWLAVRSERPDVGDAVESFRGPGLPALSCAGSWFPPVWNYGIDAKALARRFPLLLAISGSSY